jgi:homoserine dehydrogenase
MSTVEPIASAAVAAPRVPTARIGLLGCGAVGTGFLELLRRSAPRLQARTGVLPQITKVAVRDRTKSRAFERELLTDPSALVVDPAVDVVVELIGGIEPARTLVLAAIAAGKHVVTANKALLAAHGAEILGAASLRGVRVGFEASVCGGLPVLRAISQGLVANRIDRIWGVVNGTSNFILSAMEDGATFEGALEAARACGFAEADPSLDIDGHDARDKLQILVALAFGFDVDPSVIRLSSIRDVTHEDIAAARSAGLVIRQLAQADLVGDALWLSVGTVLLPERHALAWSRDEFNSLLLHGDAVGDAVFTGKGAGPLATASAVLADVVDVATVPIGVPLPRRQEVVPRIATDRRSPFHLRIFSGSPQKTAAATVQALAAHEIDVVSVTTDAKAVRLVLAENSEARVRQAVQQLGVNGSGPPLCLPLVA